MISTLTRTGRQYPQLGNVPSYPGARSLYAGIEAGEVVVAFAAPQVHLFAARNRVDLSATNNRVDLEGCEDGR